VSIIWKINFSKHTLYYTDKQDKTIQILLILFGFLMPLTVAGGNSLALIIILFWLLGGNLSKKINAIKHDKVAIASMLFFFLFVLGLFWSENLTNGLKITKKMLEFGILLPVLLSFTHKKNINYYLNGFLSAILIMTITSYSIFWEIIPPIFRGSEITNPTSFMSSVSYTPFLTIAAYILAQRIFLGLKEFYKNPSTTILEIIFFIVVSINIFFTAGRAGQYAYIILLFVFAFQKYGFKIKIFFYSTIISALILIMAFYSFNNFNNRVVSTVNNISKYQTNPASSVGHRINFNINSIRIFLENPIFGVGTGDFSSEYSKENLLFKRKNKLSSNQSVETTNPHNMHLFILTNFGILGFLIYMYFFWTLYTSAKHELDQNIKELSYAFLIFFVLINFSDSYMFGHFTSFLFVFIASFLFKNEKK